jgi:ribosomal protein S18 acetylase RimI-like enzyme
VALRFALLDPQRHDRDGFQCGEASLDVYLKQQAGQHQRDGIATTHVLVDDATPTRILGYCSLAAAQLSLAELQAEDRKRLPRYPVPAVRVSRLAVATTAQHRGIGRLLLGHAVRCALGLREQLGVRVLVVDALNGGAAAFYRSYGFRPTGPDGAILYLPLGKS